MSYVEACVPRSQRRRWFSPPTGYRDNQPGAMIQVLGGENKKLWGKFKLRFPPAPRGVHKIAVCFDLHGDGRLDVYAEDKTTGEKKVISVMTSQLQMQGVVPADQY
ncbi:hypothetical protein ACLOJK_010107 [Asimina triloba]